MALSSFVILLRIFHWEPTSWPDFLACTCSCIYICSLHPTFCHYQLLSLFSSSLLCTRFPSRSPPPSSSSLLPPLAFRENIQSSLFLNYISNSVFTKSKRGSLHIWLLPIIQHLDTRPLHFYLKTTWVDNKQSALKIIPLELDLFVSTFDRQPYWFVSLWLVFATLSSIGIDNMASAFTTQEDWLLTHHTQDVAWGPITSTDCGPASNHHRFGFEINHAVPITFIFGPSNSTDSDAKASLPRSPAGFSQDLDVTSNSEHQHRGKSHCDPVDLKFGCASSLVSSPSTSSSTELVPSPHPRLRPSGNDRKLCSTRYAHRSQARRHHNTSNCPF